MRELSLITEKGVLIKKSCKNQIEIFKFYRDMPAKLGLLFSGKPYIIREKY